MFCASRFTPFGFAVFAAMFASGPRTPAHGESREAGQLASGCSVSHRFCYDAPQNRGPLINAPQFDGGPSISADGRTLYFTSGRPGALGEAEGHYDEDLYVSSRHTERAVWARVSSAGTDQQHRVRRCPRDFCRRIVALLRPRSELSAVRHLCGMWRPDQALPTHGELPGVSAPLSTRLFTMEF